LGCALGVFLRLTHLFNFHCELLQWRTVTFQDDRIYNGVLGLQPRGQLPPRQLPSDKATRTTAT